MRTKTSNALSGMEVTAKAEGSKVKFSAEKIITFDAKKKTAEVFIFATIGDPWDGITAKAFGEAFQKIGDVDEITVYINSMGGDVWQGNTIFNLLRSHKAKKTVHIVGIAASIASVIAMAGDEIKIANNAFMFIHDAQVSAFRLNAAKLRRTADELDLVSEEIAATYARRSGGDPIELRKLMRKETLLSANKTVELGLADTLMDPVPVEAILGNLDENFKREHEEAYKEMTAELGEQPNTEENEEPGEGEENPEEVLASAEPTMEEIQARRNRLGLKLYQTERTLRELAERDTREA